MRKWHQVPNPLGFVRHSFTITFKVLFGKAFAFPQTWSAHPLGTSFLVNRWFEWSPSQAISQHYCFPLDVERSSAIKLCFAFLAFFQQTWKNRHLFGAAVNLPFAHAERKNLIDLYIVKSISVGLPFFKFNGRRVDSMPLTDNLITYYLFIMNLLILLQI